jgi:LuxR family maltose regulon positive regulatory protein
VLRLLSSELSQREIGGALYISFNTVKTHSKNIYRKLGVSQRADAVTRARELELLWSSPSPAAWITQGGPADG